MTKLEQLINELCPNGVEYKKIKDIAPFTRGKGLSKSAINTGDIPIILYGELYTTYGDYINEIVSKASQEHTKTSKTVGKGSVLIPVSSTTKEAQIGKASVLNVDEIYLGGDAVAFHPTDCIMPEYLMYVMNSMDFEKKKMKCVKGTTIQHLSPDGVASIEIPLPPLPIQREIVRILDNFTLLTAELSSKLSAELSAHKQQYEYYRDYLLTFDDEDIEKAIPDIDCSNVKSVKLSDVATVDRGKRVVRNELSQDSGYPVYQNSLAPLGYYTDTNRKADTVFVIGAGAAGEIGYSYKDYWAADDCFSFTCESILNQRYLYYWLMSKQVYLKGNVRKSSIPRLPRLALENMIISVPPIEVQNNIVKILDRFDKLCNDISEVLPAEIEARQKQYEYYRDTLLSFNQEACSHIVNVERERETSTE